MTRRRAVIGCSLAALAVAATVLVAVHESTQSIKLPDGSTLSLVKTSYGRSMDFHLQGNLFDKLLFGWVPASWMTNSTKITGIGALRNRFATGALRRSTPIYTATNALALWMQHTDVSSANSNSIFMVEAVDDNSTTWGQGNFSFAKNWPRSQTAPLAPLVTSTVRVFDRRAERVRLRVSFFSNAVWRVGGEFSIRNPDRQRSPAWVAAELPSTVTVGEDSITLRHLWTTSRSDSRPYGEIGVEFAMGRNTRSSPKWTVEKLALTDATGNRWDDGGRRISSASNSVTIQIQGGVSTNETLRVETTLVSKRDFKRDEIWEVRDVPLPSSGQTTTVTNATATRDGVTITFFGLSAADAKFPGAGMRSGSIAHFRASGFTNSAPFAWRLSVVGILDEKGRTIGHGYSPLTIASSFEFAVIHPMDIPRATFVLALHQPTNVVFHACAKQGLP